MGSYGNPLASLATGFVKGFGGGLLLRKQQQHEAEMQQEALRFKALQMVGQGVNQEDPTTWAAFTGLLNEFLGASGKRGGSKKQAGILDQAKQMQLQGVEGPVRPGYRTPEGTRAQTLEGREDQLGAITRPRTVTAGTERHPFAKSQAQQAQEDFEAKLPEMRVKAQQAMEHDLRLTDRAVELEKQRAQDQEVRDARRARLASTRNLDGLTADLIAAGRDPITARREAAETIIKDTQTKIDTRIRQQQDRDRDADRKDRALGLAFQRFEDQKVRTQIMAGNAEFRRRKAGLDLDAASARADVNRINAHINTLQGDQVKILSKMDPAKPDAKSMAALNQIDEQLKEAEVAHGNAVSHLQEVEGRVNAYADELGAPKLGDHPAAPKGKAAAASADSRGIVVGSQVEYKGRLITIDEIKDGHITKWH